MSPARRYRSCPACNAVRPASEFKLAGRQPIFGPDPRVRCPACGHVAARTYRRCQECGAVRAAIDFKRVSGKPDYGVERRVTCPACGYMAPIWAFLPAEPPAEGEKVGR
jgi:uncharacterized Zn finger protein